jgi:hypothetical protein
MEMDNREQSIYDVARTPAHTGPGANCSHPPQIDPAARLVRLYQLVA